MVWATPIEHVFAVLQAGGGKELKKMKPLGLSTKKADDFHCC
jgi:hypothetical protein